MKNKKLKLSFSKKNLGQLDNSEMYSINGGDDVEKCTINNTTCPTVATCPEKCDRDTPTINDNCNWHNTFYKCDSHDWCGYHHETNCDGPFLTVGSGK